MSKALVCGGRDFEDADYLNAKLDSFGITAIIHGGATGADTLAGIWGRANGLPVIEIHANWQFLGKAAGAIRNKWMLKYGQPDFVVAFPGGRGTANMVEEAKKAGILVIEILGKQCLL